MANPRKGLGGRPYRATDGATLNPGNAGPNVRGKGRSYVAAVQGNYSLFIPSAQEFFEARGEFLEAPKLQDMAAGLIAQWPELNQLADYRIAYLWKDKGGAKSGKGVYGKTTLASGLVKHFSTADWVIWLAADLCREAEYSDEQIEALLYHELLHCDVDEENDGKPVMRSHDFEGFKKEIERYGFWDDDMREAQEAVQARLVFQGAQP